MELYHDRYQLDEPWRKNAEGWLTEARDVKLKRDVLLWRAVIQDQTQKEEYLRRLGTAARFSHRGFVHILDVAVTGNEVYAILAKADGDRLISRLGSLNWSSRDILNQLRELMPAIREARRERLQDFALTADNLWLGSTGKLQVINYWSDADAKERDVYGLAVLLYQLCAGVKEPPASIREFQTAVSGGLKGLPGGSPADAAEWAGSAFLPSCSLREYEAGLNRLLEPSSTSPAPAPAAQAPLPRRQSRTEQPLRPDIPAPPAMPSRYEARRPPEEEPEEEGRRFRLKPWIWFTASIMLIGFLAVIGIWYATRPPAESAASTPGAPTAAAGTAADASASPGVSGSAAAHNATPKQGTASPSKPAASQKPTASPRPSASQKPTPSQSPPSKPAAGQDDGVPQTVPDLTRKTVEEASQLALKAGLRYQYVLEANELDKGLVFKQDLTPGTPVNKGDRITFYVSKGK